ncbi:MAG: DNA polymerase III subunit delta [Actinobacteria bacterium]|nr:DNA polymerase III subunit delta [Actinomycetota bacterium]NBY15981.1 DNA polymerase III subunit delta [Actinomycetota bacterium]
MAKKDAIGQNRVVLAVGRETALFNQVIARMSTIAQEIDPQFLKVELDLTNLENQVAELGQALAPSLFGEFTLLIVQNISELTEDSTALLLQNLATLPEHLMLVLWHPGGVKGKKALEAIRKTGILEADCAELKNDKLDSALVAEFNKHKRRTTVEALEALRESVGSDLGELLAAISQLCVDIESDPIDAAAVRQYYSGMSDIKSWDISDAMWNAKPKEVLEQFRWAIEQDSASAPAIIAAMAKGLRTLVKFASAPAGMSEAELATHVGVHPFRLRFLRTQKKSWLPEDLAKATRLLAQADRASKGTTYQVGIPGGVSLERAQTLYEIEKNILAMRAPKID